MLNFDSLKADITLNHTSKLIIIIMIIIMILLIEKEAYYSRNTMSL